MPLPHRQTSPPCLIGRNMAGAEGMRNRSVGKLIFRDSSMPKRRTEIKSVSLEPKGPPAGQAAGAMSSAILRLQKGQAV